MNTLIPFMLALYQGANAPIMVKITFWVLVILWAIGGIGWRDNPNYIRANSLVVCILFAILGYCTFGF